MYLRYFLYKVFQWLIPFLAFISFLLLPEMPYASAQNQVMLLKPNFVVIVVPAAPIDTPQGSQLPILSRNAKSPAVVKLQTKLKTLGFQNGPVDGIWGPDTELSVRMGQQELGVDVDGIVGSVTWKALNDALAQRIPPILSMGDSGDEVSHIQSILKGQGFLDGKIDGIYNQRTKDAVLAFQKSAQGAKFGVQADGVVGPNTWTVFNDFVSPLISKALNDPLAEGILPILGIGDSGDDVSHIQSILKDQGFLEGKVDGIYDQRTKDAVLVFQKSARGVKFGVQADGVIGPNTWRALDDDHGVR